MASPEEPAVAVEEVQDSAETVIATVVAIVAGLIVIVIALGFRRKREAERVVAREKAAAAKRKAPPPGAVARADLSAVEKLARTAGADPDAFLAGLATTEVLGRLASPLSPAAAAAVRKALAGKAELPPEGDGAAAVAAALVHTHLRRGELPARLWPKRDADEAEAAVEAVAEAAVKLTRHGFEAACKGGSPEAARCLLQLLACLRLQRPAWDHEPSRRASEEALADAGLPLPRLAASASAASWMGGAGGAVSAGSVAMLKVRLSRAHAKEAAAAAKRGATSFAGKWSTANGRAPVRVCESYTCLVSRRGGPAGGAEAMVGFLEADVLDPAAPTAEAELKIVAPLEAGEYELRVQALSLAVLGVEASASASLVVTPAPIDDADDLDDY